jgi:hypothetical protein
MQRNTIIGVALIALGIVALAYQGITYTTREKAIDIGPLEVTSERTRNIPLPPILGALALVGGVVVLVMGSRR